MKVAVYSVRKYEDKSIGWHRDCYNVRYFKTGLKKNDNDLSSYYTLTFTYRFPYSSDTVYFAYAVPYTYSYLTSTLSAIERDEKCSEFCLRKLLCRTLAGNP